MYPYHLCRNSSNERKTLVFLFACTLRSCDTGTSVPIPHTRTSESDEYEHALAARRFLLCIYAALGWSHLHPFYQMDLDVLLTASALHPFLWRMYQCMRFVWLVINIPRWHWGYRLNSNSGLGFSDIQFPSVTQAPHIYRLSSESTKYKVVDPMAI